MFDGKLAIINIGLELFSEALASQSVKVAHVDWIPSQKLEADIEEILDKVM